MAVGRRGLYEELLTQALAARLGELAPGLDAQTEPLRRADAPDRIALHLSRLVQRALAMVPDDERVGAGIALARRVVALIDAEVTRADVGDEAASAPGMVLRARALTARRPDGSSEVIEGPLIPLPMAVTWRLAHPLPGDLFVAFAAAVA